MSRPVPIVPEVLLLGTLPNPGDLERSIRLQLTPGSGPAPEMAMAAAGAPGRSGLDIGGGLGVSELQRRTLHPAEPARPRRRRRPGGRAVHPRDRPPAECVCRAVAPGRNHSPDRNGEGSRPAR